MRILSFNDQATKAISGRKGSKLRIDVKDGNVMVRPTDRKAGPHTLTEQIVGDDKVQIEITDKQLDKLGATALLVANGTLGLRATKYGWFMLTTHAAMEGDELVEGAQVSVKLAEGPEAA
jgi:hypothetical protein